MIVVSYGEGDIDRIAGEERSLLHAFGHVPAEGVEGDFVSKVGSQVSILSAQCAADCIAFCHGCSLFFATDGGAVGMAAWGGEDGGCGKFPRFCSCPDFQLDVLVFQNARRCGELHTARCKYRLGISHAVGFEQFESMEKFGRDLGQIKFGIQIESRIEICERETSAGEGVQLHSQIFNVG